MQVRVSDLIDRNPLSGFQLRIIAICALVTLLDGVDIQAMSVVAPTISSEWGVPASVLGPVLSATFAGITVGAMLFGVMGDRFGRKIVLLGSFALVGLMSLLTSFVNSPTEMLILRFLTGLGIGGALPNATALTAEYAPASKRVFLITAMYCGVPLGASAVAFLSPMLIEMFSWRAVFIVGGVLPLLLSLAIIWGLPESARFIVAKGGDPRKVAAILEKIDRTYKYDPSHTFVVDHEVKGNSVANLFKEHRALLTIGLWLVFFSSFFGFYILTSWLPVIFTEADWPRAAALRTIAVFQLGVVFGALSCGWLIDRSKAFLVLGVYYFLASLIVLGVGALASSMGAVMALMVVAGAAFGGAQVCIVAVAANVYPTNARSTGVGWALGAGRTGAVISPIIAGFAIAAEWETQAVFALSAVPALICAALCIMLLVNERMKTRAAAARL